MQTLTPEASHYLTLFTRQPEQQEPQWLRRMRTSSIEHFARAGFPAANAEDWRYTRLTGWQSRAFTLAPRPETFALPQAFVETPFPHRLVFVDGYPAVSPAGGALPAGVTVLEWQTALQQQPEQLQHWLSATQPETPFAALNSAFFSSGAVIHLAAGVRLEQPLHLLWLSSASCESTMQHPRLLIVAEADSALTLIEEYASIGQTTHFSNAVSRLYLGERAQVEHYHLQDGSEKSLSLAELSVAQAAGSHYVSAMVALGGALARQEIQVSLSGPQASCNLHGLYLARGRQHLDFHTRIDHFAKECSSRENYRGILAGFARAVFSGKIMVHKDAQRTDSNQQNKTLLLNDNAEIDTKPQLEIFANDVKCAHGATVGQLDPESLFYLRSRGIAAAEARHLLMQGFARQMLQALPDERAASWLEARVARKLEAFAAV